MGDDMRTLAITDSGMVLIHEILTGIPPDILAGLGVLVAVPHDVICHLTVLAAKGDPNASNHGLMMQPRLGYLATLWCALSSNDKPSTSRQPSQVSSHNIRDSR
jgi:hypothetical protein